MIVFLVNNFSVISSISNGNRTPFLTNYYGRKLMLKPGGGVGGFGSATGTGLIKIFICGLEFIIINDIVKKTIHTNETKTERNTISFRRFIDAVR